MSESTTPPPPHAAAAAAEQDSRQASRAANQTRDEPFRPTPAHDGTPSAGTDEPDGAGDSLTGRRSEPVESQAGVPDRAVTDVAPASGTSEAMAPVDGLHQPDVEPGGAQFDTAERAAPNRTTDLP